MNRLLECLQGFCSSLLLRSGKMITWIKPSRVWFHMAGWLAPFLHWWETHGVRTACSFQDGCRGGPARFFLFGEAALKGSHHPISVPSSPHRAADCYLAFQWRLAVPPGKARVCLPAGMQWRKMEDGEWLLPLPPPPPLPLLLLRFPVCENEPINSAPSPAFPRALPVPVVSVC